MTKHNHDQSGKSEERKLDDVARPDQLFRLLEDIYKTHKAPEARQ